VKTRGKQIIERDGHRLREFAVAEAGDFGWIDAGQKKAGITHPFNFDDVAGKNGAVGTKRVDECSAGFILDEYVMARIKRGHHPA